MDSLEKTIRSATRPFFRKWRKYRRLTQEQVAESAELSPASISQLETGKQGWSEETLCALSYTYNCEIGDLWQDPTTPDYAIWRIIRSLKSDEKRQALRVLEALAGKNAA